MAFWSAALWYCCVNATMFDRYGAADDFLDCFIIPARIVGGTFWD